MILDFECDRIKSGTVKECGECDIHEACRAEKDKKALEDALAQDRKDVNGDG